MKCALTVNPQFPMYQDSQHDPQDMRETQLLPITLFRFVMSLTEPLQSCDDPMLWAGGNGYFSAIDVSLIQLKAH